ncbi:Plug domain-containing protein [Sphingomonas aerolata]
MPDPDTKDILVVGQHAQDTLTTPNATGSRLGLTPLETPATLSVIDGATIRARGDLSVIDATSRAPGISNAGNPGNGGTALAARGSAVRAPCSSSSTASGCSRRPARSPFRPIRGWSNGSTS